MNQKEKTLISIRITKLKKKIDSFELNESKYEKAYCDMLDKTPVKIDSMVYCASKVLQAIDPIVYEIGLISFTDKQPLTDDKDYCNLEVELKELEEKLNTISTVNEWCPHCEEDITLPAIMQIYKCPICTHRLKPCALCDIDIVNCNKCKLD